MKEGLRITGAVQVCYEITKKNKEREVSGLLEAMDKFKLKEGMIITYDDEDSIVMEDKKVKVIPAWKWALD